MKQKKMKHTNETQMLNRKSTNTPLLLFIFACTLTLKSVFREFLETQLRSRKCVFVQVNNYEIIVNFFQISHNLTWYSAIVHKFTKTNPVCSTYELKKQFMKVSVKNCAINLKKNNLYSFYWAFGSNLSASCRQIKGNMISKAIFFFASSKM